ncbi:MAG: SLC13 family permease [Sumerlaeia bacterium]
MDLFSLLCLIIIGSVILGLAFSRTSPETTLLAGLIALILFSGLLPGEELFPVEVAFKGFANPGVISIAALYIIAAGIRETGAVFFLINRLLGIPKSLFSAHLRLMLPVAAVSGFVNNTPLVAVMMPIVCDWSKKIQQPLSRLLIPLSFAAILGGICTLMGTNTNLLVYGELQRNADTTLGFFEITKIGLPCALIGIAYLMVMAPRLPDRTPKAGALSDPREYTLEMIVEPASSLVGKTIEAAGLRHLPGVYLIEIDREGEVLAAVAPNEKLQANDRLVFAGVVDSVVDLQKIPGLKPATNQMFKLNGGGERLLIEAVVSHQSPLIGRTIRDGKFRTHYNAAIIAVARDGERVEKKIGDIVLQPGDVLLLEGRQAFWEKNRNARDFYLLRRIEGFTPPRHDRAWLALTVLAGMVISILLLKVEIQNAALAGASAMILFRCLSLDIARRSIDVRVLLAIVAALGLGSALQISGLAKTLVEHSLALTGGSVLISMFVFYVLTMIVSEFLTNSAAASLMIQFAFPLAESLGIPIISLAVLVMIASSAAFGTPIGYQTNLMIYGPGGYRFTDFMRIGVPLDFILAVSATLLTYWFYIA